ncbi:MAG: hypothetical protein ACI4QN_00280 [Candidatus Coproplasma sp.]
MNAPIISVKTSPKVTVRVLVKHTTIPNDYEKLKNKPKINGVEVSGELSSDEIKLLSAIVQDYPETSLNEVSGQVVVLTKNGKSVLPFKSLIDYINSASITPVEVVGDSGDVVKEIKPNTLYSFTGNLTTLQIAFSEPVQGKENEYKGQFVVGSTIPTVLFPDTVKWVGDEFPALEENKTYQFSVLNNVGVIIGV